LPRKSRKELNRKKDRSLTTDFADSTDSGTGRYRHKKTLKSAKEIDRFLAGGGAVAGQGGILQELTASSRQHSRAVNLKFVPFNGAQNTIQKSFNSPQSTRSVVGIIADCFPFPANDRGREG
jgi:hypothetical protein